MKGEEQLDTYFETTTMEAWCVYGRKQTTNDFLFLKHSHKKSHNLHENMNTFPLLSFVMIHFPHGISPFVPHPHKLLVAFIEHELLSEWSEKYSLKNVGGKRGKKKKKIKMMKKSNGMKKIFSFYNFFCFFFFMPLQSNEIKFLSIKCYFPILYGK